MSTIYGTAGNNIIGGDQIEPESDTIHGLEGNDTLNGNAFADVVYGGNDDDTLRGGSDADSLYGGDGIDTARFTASITTANISFDVDDQVWMVDAGEAEGTDLLSGVEIVDGGLAGGAKILLVGAGGFATIQEAVAAADSGDTIMVATGTYSGDITLTEGVTLVGAKHGVSGDSRTASDATGETTIIGRIVVNTTEAVTIDGLRFVGILAENAASLTFQQGGAGDGHLVTNTVFYGPAGGGANGVTNRAILMTPMATGMVTVDDNLFDGVSTNGFGGAAWGRGIWVDGGGAAIVITDNMFNGTRSAINYDDTTGAVATITDNTFALAGTAVSFAAGHGGNGVEDNTFGTVGGYLNYRNSTTGVTYDLGESGNTDSDGAAGSIDGSKVNDVITGSDLGDTLVGMGGGDTLSGEDGNDILIGGLNGFAGGGTEGGDVLYGGAGNDQLAGDAGGDVLYGGTEDDSMAGGTEGDALYGGEGVDLLQGQAGDDVLNGGAGGDSLVGGDNTDTAVYTSEIELEDLSVVSGAWQVNGDVAEGTDLLNGVEIVDGGEEGRILLVGAGGFATIQAAIDAAVEGDTVLISAGTYSENVVVDVAGITLVGQGAVTIQGTFATDNGVTGDLSVWIQTAGAYSGAAGAGVTIDADDVTLSNINIDGFLQGVRFASDVEDTALTDIDISNTVFGIDKTDTANIDGLTITNGSVTDGYIGILFAKVVPGPRDEGLAENVLIDGMHFEDLTAKGIYVEALSDSTITGVTMENAGFYGAGEAFYDVAPYAGVGIELNLKNGDYKNVTITDFELHNSGAVLHDNAAAISVKTRDDGGTYGSGNAAVWVGDPLVISDGVIDTAATGIRSGETNRENSGPEVSISNVEITGALHDASNGDVENFSQSAMTVNLTDGADVLVSSPQARTPSGTMGSLEIHGLDGDDQITGGAGNDVIAGGEGNDAITGGAGTDTAVYTGTIDLSDLTVEGGSWHVDGGVAEGTDVLNGVEIVNGDGDGKVLLVGAGGFETIQAAVNAASAGDTVLISAGTYNESVSITKGVNLVGQDGAIISATGSDAILIGVGVAGADVSISNLEIIGPMGSNFVGTGVRVVEGANVDTLTLDSVNIHGAGAYGVVVMGDDESGPGATAAANVVITNSQFSNNGYNGTNGSAHIKFFGFDGDATLDNLTLTGSPDATAVVSRADYGIEFHGIPNSKLSSQTVPDMGTVSISDVTVTGEFHKNVVALNNYGNLDGLSIEGVDLSGAETDWGPVFNIDKVSGDIDASEFDITFPSTLPPNGYVAELQGDGSPMPGANQAITGTDVAERLRGGGGDDDLSAGGANDVLDGGTGNDDLTGGTGSDSLIGGSGTDTAVYSGNIDLDDLSVGDVNTVTLGTQEGWVLNGDSEGTDLLNGVEIVDGGEAGRILLVGAGGFATINAAIDAAVTGDTILISAGNYAENVVVDVAGITLQGMPGVVIKGSFSTDNATGGDVSQFLTTATAYSGTSGSGVTIAASGVTLKNLDIDGFRYGIDFQTDVSGTTLDSVDILHTVIGIEKGAEANIDGLTITGGSITDGYIGIDFAKTITAGQQTNGLAENVTIDGMSFSDLTAKGIYAEALSHSLITGISMNEVGFYGIGPAFGGGANGNPNRPAGVGIELNLKNGEYEDVTITDFTLTNTGTSDLDNAAAISVKTRDDGGTYGPVPATWVGDPLEISGGTINGTTTGIRSGETNRENSGPEVSVTNVAITGALHNASNGDVENFSQSAMTVNLTDGADVLVSSPQARTPSGTMGSLEINGLDGDDQITGGAGNDVIAGGEGNDAITGGAGTDTAAYDGDAAGYNASIVNGVLTVTDTDDGNGDEGIDSLYGIEALSFDGVTQSVTAATTIEISGFSGSVAEESALVFDVNIADPDDTASISIVLSVEHGFLKVVASGGAAVGGNNGDTVTVSGTLADVQASLQNIEYRSGDDEPGDEFAGIDTLTVSTVDGTIAVSQTATVTVTPTNDDPVGVNDTAEVIEGFSVSVPTAANVLDNDTDAEDDTLTVSGVSNVTSGTGTVGSPLVGVYGMLTLNADGSYTYTANQAAANVLAEGDEADDVFTYEVNDGNGGTGTAMLTITVTGDNDAPTFTTGTVSTSIDENTTAVLTVSASDIDTGDDITYSVTGGADQLLFEINAETGELSFAVAPDFEAPNDTFGTPGDNIYQVVVTATDSEGASVDQTITVTVENTPPQLVPTLGPVDENTALVGSVNVGDGSGVNYTILPLFDGAKFEIDANGVLSFKDAPDFEAPTDVGAPSNVYKVTVLAVDNEGGTSSLTYNIVVNDVDEVPVAADDADDITEGDAAITGNVLTNDFVELDRVPARSVSKVEGLSGNVGISIEGDYGTLTLNADGSYSYEANLAAALALAEGEEAVETFDYVLTDGTVREDTATLSITVTGRNQAPVAVADVPAALAENVGGTYNVVLNDTDVDNSDTKTLTAINSVSATGLGTLSGADEIALGAAFSVVDNKVEFAPGTGFPGTLSLFDRLDPGQTATVTVTYTVEDSEGATSSSTLTLTINGAAEIVNGTAGHDTALNGSAYVDVISGDDGNDKIFGGDGADTIYGGNGNETMYGGTGADTMHGEAGNDTYSIDNVGDLIVEAVGGGADTALVSVSGVSIGANVERITVASGSGLAVTGNNNANTFTGGAGNDVFVGLNGVDRFIGGAGADTFFGGSGNDIFRIEDAGDVASETGGTGTDLAEIFASGAVIGAGIEHIDILAAFAVTVTADGGTNNLINGGAFGDVINAGAGNDVVNGAAGSDTLFGDVGNDTLYGGTGADQLFGGAGNDTYVVEDLGYGVSEVDGSGSADQALVFAAVAAIGDGIERIDVMTDGGATITANGSTNNVIFGAGGIDILSAGGGNDTLYGGAGADTFYGGDGNDLFYIQDAGDISNEAGGEGTADRAVVSVTGAIIGADIERIELVGLAGLTVTAAGNTENTITGSAHDDVIFAGAGKDILNGGDGVDTLNGGDGNDTMYGGAGSDSMYGGEGDDVYRIEDAGDVSGDTGAIGADRAMVYSSGAVIGEGIERIDIMIGTGATVTAAGSTNNTLTGGAGDDVLIAGAGDDFMYGGEGADTYYGGEGDDIYRFADVGDVGVDTGSTAMDKAYVYASSATVGESIERINVLVDTGATVTAAGDTDNVMTGSIGSDTLIAGSGADTLSGGDGLDRLVGGAGNDRLTSGIGADIFEYHDGDGDDRILDMTSADKVELHDGLTVASMAGNVVTLSSGGTITAQTGWGWVAEDFIYPV